MGQFISWKQILQSFDYFAKITPTLIFLQLLLTYLVSIYKMYIVLANLSRQTGVVQIWLHLFGYCLRQNVCKQKMSKDRSRLLEFKNQYKSDDLISCMEDHFYLAQISNLQIWTLRILAGFLMYACVCWGFAQFANKLPDPEYQKLVTYVTFKRYLLTFFGTWYHLVDVVQMTYVYVYFFIQVFFMHIFAQVVRKKQLFSHWRPRKIPIFLHIPYSKSYTIMEI